VRLPLIAVLLAASSAAAQTTPPTLHPPVKHAAKSAHHAAKPSAAVPVVPPRHAPPRKARHPAAKLVEAPQKPEPKTVPKAPPAKPAPPPVPADVGTVTGLHLPRFASLKTDEVNMRAGPASRFPILWTYHRRDLPVKIEREFDVWRLVEDMDGIKGWVHQATLAGHRSFVITGNDAKTLRSDASATSAPVAMLKPGVVGHIRNCDAGADWCQVQAGDYRGWLQREDFWGTDAGEAVSP
jgi:SH3-like domain-containing protein